jgi:hypothetical protein
MSVTKVSSAMQDAMVVADLPAGSTVQQVYTQTGATITGTTTMPADDTLPQVTEGNEVMTLAITPTHASNILEITVVSMTTRSGDAHNITIALFNTNYHSTNAMATAFYTGAGGQHVNHSSFKARMTAGTTSASTFKVRAGATGAGTMTFNGNAGGRLHAGVMASSITITEIQA